MCLFCPKDFDECLVHLDTSGRLQCNSGMRKYYTTESDESSVAICKCRLVLNGPFHGHSINMKEYPYDCMLLEMNIKLFLQNLKPKKQIFRLSRLRKTQRKEKTQVVFSRKKSIARKGFKSFFVILIFRLSLCCQHPVFDILILDKDTSNPLCLH